MIVKTLYDPALQNENKSYRKTSNRLILKV